MKRAIFYRAGCPACCLAEDALLEALDRSKLQLEVVHLGQQKDRVKDAVQAGVESVPALVIDGTVLHINFGASIRDLTAPEGPAEKDQEEVVASMKQGWGIR